MEGFQQAIEAVREMQVMNRPGDLLEICKTLQSA
jgi:hypothetical protein